MKRIVLLTFLFLFLNSFFAACCLVPSTCGCGDNKNTSYKATDFTLRLFELSDEKTFPDLNFELPANPRVTSNEFAFVFTPNIISIALIQMHFSLPGLVYACDISDNPTQEFVSVRITSNAEYRTNANSIAAGDDLSQLFKFGSLSVSDFLAQSNKSVGRDYFFMTLTAQPSSQTTHQFTFEFELSDGNTFTVVSDSIDLI